MSNRLSELSRGRENLVFALIQGLFWAANCMLYGFWVAYLQHIGFSYMLIGLTTTLMSATGMALQPIAGYISDTYIPAKRFFIGCVLISSPLVLLLPFVSSLPVVTVVLMLVIVVFHCSLGGMIDSWTVKLREQGVIINYPVTRSAGSVGYGLSALLLGWVISRLGYNIMFVAHISLLLSTAFVALFAQGVPCSNRKREQESEGRIGLPAALMMLLKNPRYMIFLVSAIFYNLGVRVTITYTATIISLKGGGSSELGMALFIAAFCEFPIVIAFVAISKRIRIQKIFMVAMIFGFLRVFGVYLAPNVSLLMLCQLCQAISFGLYIPLFVEYVSRIVPQKISATAIIVAQAVATGLGSIVGNSAGGMILDKYGLTAFVMTNSVCVGVGIIIFSASFFVKKSQQKA